MSASAVDPLHSPVARERATGTRSNGYPPIRCCDKPACSIRGMQAGGLAAQSVDVLWGLAPFFLAPVPVPAQRDRHRRRRRSQSLTLVQWVERNEPS